MPSPDRLRTKIANIPLHAAQLTPLSLILNELATNATKYGCRSTETGILHLTISGQDAISQIRWEERGGPAPQPPPTTSPGFGTEMLDACARKLGGVLHRTWTSDGLNISISFAKGRDVPNV